MKILITTGVYPPEIGGPATYSKLLFDELPQRGVEVEVLPFAAVRQLPKVIRHLVYFFKIIKRAKGVEIIYAQDPVSVGLPTAVACFFLRKRFFIRIAGDYAWEQGVQRFGVKDDLDTFSLKNNYGWFVSGLKKIQTLVAQRAEIIIVPSHYFRGIIINWGIKPEKIKVIYNGIKLHNHLDVRRPSGAEKTILSVGRLVPWKGFGVLIETLPAIIAEIPNIKLIIVGDGPQRQELEKKIKDLNLEDEVILKGQLSREELLEQKKKADIFVFNTNWESFSFDTVEALALGLPVVATRVGSLPELIENGREGFLVQANNKEEIKVAVLKILKNDDLRREIVERAFQKSKQFSLENTLNELIKIIKK